MSEETEELYTSSYQIRKEVEAAKSIYAVNIILDKYHRSLSVMPELYKSKLLERVEKHKKNLTKE